MQSKRTFHPLIRTFSFVFALGVLGLAPGCSQLLSGKPDAKAQSDTAVAGEVVYRKNVPSVTRTVMSKSYRVGEAYRVRVNTPLVSVKNYTVAERVTRAVALEDFEQTCAGVLSGTGQACSGLPLSSIRGGLGDTFDIAGTAEAGGQTYFMVGLPAAGARVYLLVDSNGYLAEGAYVAWRSSTDERFHVRGMPHGLVAPPRSLQTAGPLFSLESDETFVSSGARYLNYDIFYRGTGNDVRGEIYRLVYREYGRSASPVPIFQQNLAYPMAQGTIDILGLRMKISGADASGIGFTVVQEALPNS
ncbi:MAG: hypothetical protein ACI8TX_000367 [Hyphomicrobiaceae bacterium]